MLRLMLMTAVVLFLGSAPVGAVAAGKGAELRGAAASPFQQVARKRAHRTSDALPAPQPQIVAPLPPPRFGTSTIPVPPPAIPPGSTFQDRVFLCTHQAGSFGVTPDQMGVYVHNCAM